MSKHLLKVNSQKIFFAVVLQVLLTMQAQSQITYKWTNGFGNNDWQEPQNWSPIRTKPSDKDIVLFDNISTTVYYTPTQETIGSLVLSNNSSVNFSVPHPNIKVYSKQHGLTIGGLKGGRVKIDPGCSLNFANNFRNSDEVNIFLSQNSLAFIKGSVVFSAANYTLNAQDKEAINFLAGSTCTLNFYNDPLWANTFTSSGTPNTVVFRDGSELKHQAGVTQFGLTAPASKIVFEPNSLYNASDWADFSGGAFSGRTFGNVRLSQYFGRRSTLILGGNLPVTVNNLTLPYNMFTYEFAFNGGLNIKGNLYNNTRLSVAYGSRVNFIGTTPQIISLGISPPPPNSYSAAINIQNSATLKINNPSGVTIENTFWNNTANASNFIIDGTLDLTDGIVSVPNSSGGIFFRGADYINASEKSFIDGKIIRMAYLSPFKYPVGKTGIGYAPLEVTLNSYMGSISVKYNSSNPILNNGKYPAGVDHVSQAGYWEVEEAVGTLTYQPNVTFTAFWNSQITSGGSANYITNLNTLTLAHYLASPSGWVNYGGTANAGSNEKEGSITWTNANMSGSTGLPPNNIFLHIISLASTNKDNPLQLENPSVALKTSMQTQDAIPTPIVSGLKFYPTIVNSLANIEITTKKKTLVVATITNSIGSSVMQQQFRAIEGTNRFAINTSNLPAGIYFINIKSDIDKVATIKFVKQ